jgi:hypothetical protein
MIRGNLDFLIELCKVQLGEAMNAKDKKRVFSIQTRNNIVLDMAMLIAALASILSGIYFLFLPVGGFQGGRNPLYGVVIFFERHTWSDIHAWASVIIISLAAMHIPLHWSWITKMTRSGLRGLAGQGSLNKFGQFNLAINILIGLSGLICALSGLYFLFEPALLAPSQGGWIFTRSNWDLIHTWSGVVVTAAAILHFAIHWRWVVKVLSKYGRAKMDDISLAGNGRQVDTVPVSAEEI